MPISYKRSRAIQILLTRWKWLLSFRKQEWELRDYPVQISKQAGHPEPSLPPRLKVPRYRICIANWWWLAGMGASIDEARAELEQRFRDENEKRRSEGRALPRPGMQVPIEFASNERVKRHPEFYEDFVRRVLEIDWALITDESSLVHFHTDETDAALIEKIATIYGLDVSSIKSGNIADIFDLISQKQKSPL